MIDRALLQKSLVRWATAAHSQRRELVPRRHIPDPPASDLCLAISGIRRCGKTTLAIELSKQYEPSEVLYYNFEDPLFLGEEDPGGIELLFSLFEENHGTSPKFVILDEVHNVPGWERWVRSSVDQRRSRFIVTGSNAKLLSADLATSLTGRGLEFVAWPLSLSEAFDFLVPLHGDSGNDLRKEYYLQQLLSWGGLPAVILTQDEVKRESLLRQYLSDLIHKDVINRRSIRNKRALDQLVTYYHTNLSSLHSYSAIKKAFGIPIDTTAEYTSALSEAFLIFEVERFHPNLKVQSRDSRKVYVGDLGIRRVAARSAEADIGKLLENLVYLELRRQNKSLYYYHQDGEVDFLVTERYEPTMAIQVCAYGMDRQETREREISALVNCMNELELSDGLIITMDRDETIEVKGKTIRSMSAARWLS